MSGEAASVLDLLLQLVGQLCWGSSRGSGQDVTLFFVFLKIDLMPHDLITQLLRVLAIETKQEKAMVHADPTELTLSGLEAFSFDYVVKWPLSLIINR